MEENQNQTINNNELNANNGSKTTVVNQIISSEDFWKNYEFGKTNKQIPVEYKNKFPYLPWAYIYFFLGTYGYNHIEIRFLENDIIEQHQLLDRLPVSGNSKQGYAVHPYLYDRQNNIRTPLFYYPVTDMKNNPIYELTNYHLNTSKMRAMTKMVASYLGLCLHLFMNVDDMLNDSEMLKLKQEEDQEKQETIKQIKSALSKIKNLSQHIREDDDIDINNLNDEYKLNQKEVVELRQIYNKIKKFGCKLKLRSNLEDYKEKANEEHPYAKRLSEIEEQSADYITECFKEVANQTPSKGNNNK